MGRIFSGFKSIGAFLFRCQDFGSGAKVCFGFIFLFLFRAISFHLPYWSLDETEYSVAGMILQQGGLPYRDFHIHHPPLIFYLYAGIFYLLGGWNLVAVHAVFIGFVLGNYLLLIHLAKRRWKVEPGWIAVILWPIGLGGFLGKDAMAANVEIPLNLTLCLCAFFLLWGHEKRRGWLFLAGAVWGGALAFKQHALFFLPAAGWWLWTGSAPKRGVERLMWFLGGSLLVPLGFSLYFLRVDLLGETWAVLIRSNLDYLAAIRTLRGPLAQNLLYYSWKIFFRLTLLALSLWPLFVGAGRNLFCLQRREPLQGFYLLWFWGMFLTCFLGGRLFWHYFLLLVPPLVILASSPHSMLQGLLASRYRWGVGVLMIVPFLFYQAEALGVLRLQVPYALRGCERELGEKIQRETDPQERIWVWGFLPQIYFHARRLPATRFVQCDPLSGLTRLTPGQFPTQESLTARIRADLGGSVSSRELDDAADVDTTRAWEDLWRDIQRHPPVRFVDTSPSGVNFYEFAPLSRFPRLNLWVQEEYQLIGKSCRYLVYSRHEGLRERNY